LKFLEAFPAKCMFGGFAADYFDPSRNVIMFGGRDPHASRISCAPEQPLDASTDNGVLLPTSRGSCQASAFSVFRRLF